MFSGTTIDQLKSKFEVGYESLGGVQVKNIKQAVCAYKVLTDSDQVGKTIGDKQIRLVITRPFAAIAATLLVAIISGGGWWWSLQPDFEPAELEKYAFKLPEEPSIAVLPFDKLSNDKSQGFIGDELVENIIGALATSPDLLVITRSSTFAYR